MLSCLTKRIPAVHPAASLCVVLGCARLTVFVSGSSAALQAADASSADSVSFSQDIAPVLARKCVTCHGPEKTKGGYQLHTFATLMNPGESREPSITPGQPEKSEVFRRIAAKDADDRMPQKDDPLPAEQLALVERWIRAGAKFDGADTKQSLASLVDAGPQPDPPAMYVRPVPVLALAFSPDGHALAAGGYHEITIWDPSDGRLLQRIRNVAQQTASLSFSPDGAALAAAGGTPGTLGEVKLFNPRSGALLKTLAPAGDMMLAVSFSPDGKRLAAAGSDAAIRIFDAATGRLELIIEQHADWVTGLAFSPDGRVLASASRDKTARLFDTTTGELEQTYTGHNGPVFSVAFCSDGEQVVSASRDKEIHVWDAKEAKKSAEIGGFEGDVLRVLVQDDQIFSISSDRIARQHSLTHKKPELVRTFSGHKDVLYGLAHHEPSHRIATSSFDGAVRVWNTSDGTELTHFIAAPGYRSEASPSANAQR